jgi:hypothetical protein
MEAPEIHKKGIEMKDLLELLIEAKNKLTFDTQNNFINALNEVKQFDTTLDLDWDNGAGEEWARFIHHEIGKIYMLNSKIGVVFVREIYSDRLPQILYSKYKICLVDNYAEKEWHIDLEALAKGIPEIVWHTSTDIIDPNKFSLDDFYYATI